jgi:glycosyltransferase involved in cell wall biosynthesis
MTNQATVAILQPFIPHYREDFFKGLGEKLKCEIYCYEKKEDLKKHNFQHADIKTTYIKALAIKVFLLYNPFALLKKRHKTLVLMLNIGHITTWLLLLTKFIHRKEIILWGHGISIKRYIAEEKRPSRPIRWMIFLADGIWFYTDTEQQLWKKVFPFLKSVSLNNTISDVDRIVDMPMADKADIRKKYKITQQRVFIFCARFNIIERRIDLLEEVIKTLDSETFAFIIIGDGQLKPDFSRYKNVYDFGEVYDRQVKNELFLAADIYFQPGWVGLSVVEALAYGLPVFTFKRSDLILQCVEYAYIENGFNGLLFNNVASLIEKAKSLSVEEIDNMSINSKRFARKHLSMENMITAGAGLIKNEYLIS